MLMPFAVLSRKSFAGDAVQPADPARLTSLICASLELPWDAAYGSHPENTG